MANDRLYDGQKLDSEYLLRYRINELDLKAGEIRLLEKVTRERLRKLLCREYGGGSVFKVSVIAELGSLDLLASLGVGSVMGFLRDAGERLGPYNTLWSVISKMGPVLKRAFLEARKRLSDGSDSVPPEPELVEENHRPGLVELIDKAIQDHRAGQLSHEACGKRLRDFFASIQNLDPGGSTLPRLLGYVADSYGELFAWEALVPNIKTSPARAASSQYADERRLIKKKIAQADLLLRRRYEALREYLRGLGQDVRFELKAYWAEAKTLRSFASIEVHPSRAHRKIRIHTCLDPDSVLLEAGFTRDMRGVDHLGVGDLEILIRSNSDLDKAKPLLRRAYAEARVA